MNEGRKPPLLMPPRRSDRAPIDLARQNALDAGRPVDGPPASQKSSTLIPVTRSESPFVLLQPKSLDRRPILGAISQARALSVQSGTADVALRSARAGQGVYKANRTVQTNGLQWAVVTVESNFVLPAGADALAPQLAQRLVECCDILARLGFQQAIFDVYQKASLPWAATRQLGNVIQAGIHFSDGGRGKSYACAIIVDRARARQFDKSITAQDLAAYYPKTGLVIIPTDADGIGRLRLEALSTGLRPELLHELYHAAERAKMPSFYRLRAAHPREYLAWQWLVEGTATAVEMLQAMGNGAGDFTSNVREFLRQNRDVSSFWRDWFSPVDAWGADLPQYSVGSMFLASDRGALRYLETLLGRIDDALSELDDFPASSYSVMDRALRRVGAAPGLVRPFSGLPPTQGGSTLVSGFAAMYVRGVATCGRYDPGIPDEENLAANRGSLDGFHGVLNASSARTMREDEVDFPLYNLSSDGRAYYYDGNDRRTGVRITLDANWNRALYVLVGDALASEFELVFANSPGAIIEIPWVPSRVRPLVVSVLHVDVEGGPTANRLSWRYTARFY